MRSSIRVAVPSSRSVVTGWLILMCALHCGSVGLFAQPAAKPVAAPYPAAGSTTGSDLSQKAPAAQNSFPANPRNDKIQIVYVLFLGVVLLMVALIAIVLLGGSWARRLAREPLPPVKRPDELWYLKNPEGSEPPGSLPQTTSPPPETPPQEPRGD